MAYKIRMIVLAMAVLLCAPFCKASPTSEGTDFWLCIPGSYYSPYSSGQSPAKQLMITSRTNTTATIYITISLSPITTFNKTVNITAGSITYVDLPWNSDVFDSDLVSPRGIHVTSPDPVTVYGYSHSAVITDAFLGLPVEALGTNHIVLSYNNGGTNNPVGSEFAVVATEDNTWVTINLTCTIGTRTKNVPYIITLDKGQVYLLRDDNGSTGDDLSGTTIDSDKRVAVFGAHICADVPANYDYCNYLVEQLPPTTDWGKQFFLIPLAGRSGTDTYRIMASQNSTSLYLNGTIISGVTLNKGDFYEAQITGTGMLTSNNRIMVMQYSNSTTFDSTVGDPFMMLIEPVEQYLTDYTVGTAQSGFSYNYLNIAAPDTAVGSVTVDGLTISPASFTSIPGSGYSVTRVIVGLGSHNVSSPFGVGLNVYGFDNQDGYGYPGGAGMIDFVSTPTPTITPTNTATPTRTPTRTPSPIGTKTFTRTPSVTPTWTASPDFTGTITPTMTQTYTVTESLTVTPTNTLSNTPTSTFTATPSQTATFTETQLASLTNTPTRTQTFTYTVTRTYTPTFTATRTLTPTGTATKTYTPTLTPTITPTPQNTPTSTPEPPALNLILKGNYENPFKDATHIVFWLSRDALVCIKVYTVSGEVVVETCGIQGNAGYNSFLWDGKNRAGKHIASGTFIYSVTAETDIGEKARAFSKLVCVR